MTDDGASNCIITKKQLIKYNLNVTVRCRCRIQIEMLDAATNTTTHCVAISVNCEFLIAINKSCE